MTDRKEFRELVDPETAEAAVAALPIDPGTEERPLEAARGAVLARVRTAVEQADHVGVAAVDEVDGREAGLERTDRRFRSHRRTP